MQWGIGFEKFHFAEFALEGFFLCWNRNLDLLVKRVEFLAFFNVLLSEVILSSCNFVQNHLNMILFFLCVQFVIMFLQVFLFERDDGVLEKFWADSVQKFGHHFSESDILGDDHLFVKTKLFVIVDSVHGDKRYLFR